MSGFIVLQQMILIFILIFTGFILYKKRLISQYAAKDLSALVVNVCSPGLIVSSMFQDLSSVTRDSVILVALIAVCYFIVLTILGYILVKVLKVQKEHKTPYILMTIFGNLGFIGIPVAMAIIGPESMVYIVVFNFLFNVYMYTFGVFLLKKGTKGVKTSWKDMLSPGLLACVLAFCIYWFELNPPESVRAIAGYYGNACTLLSMVVIGISIADMHVKALLKNKRMLFFTVIRFILFPVGIALLLKPFLSDYVMRATIVLMAALPVGNLAAMLSRQYDKDAKPIEEGIIVTTLLSVITISITFLFV